jgi:hypothetical protein
VPDPVMAVRRLRGLLLRLIRRRAGAVAAGVLLLTPAVWLEATGGHAVWWVEGLGLVVGATGAALVWAGLTGRRPDWIDEGE